MSTFLDIDQKIFLALNFDGGKFADNLFWIASGKLTWIPLYIIILLLIYRHYGLKYTALALLFMGLMVGAADQIAGFFKHYTPKLRPTHTPEIENIVHIVKGYRGGLYGTISAHAATLISIAAFSASLIRTRWFTIFIYLWALFVAYSRIYLGVHYPADILFGVITGLVVAVVAIKLFHLTINRIEQ